MPVWPTVHSLSRHPDSFIFSGNSLLQYTQYGLAREAPASPIRTTALASRRPSPVLSPEQTADSSGKTSGAPSISGASLNEVRDH